MIGGFVLETPEIPKESRTVVIKKPYVVIAAAVLFVAAYPVLAQHQHGGGPSGVGGAVPDYSSAMGEFQRAIAAQATAEQAAQWRTWTQKTATLNQELEDIRHMSESRKSDALSDDIDTFKAALVTDNLVRQEFLDSLSRTQRSELRKQVRRLNRANNSMAEAFSDITKSFGRSQNTKLLTKGLQRTKKALAIERDEQQRLAREMGVTV